MSQGARSRWRSAGALHGLSLLLLAHFSPACKAREDFRDPEPEMLARAEVMPVTLSTELRRLREEGTYSGQKTTYRIGGLLQRLFSSGNGQAFLSLEASRFDIEWTSQAWSSKYQLSVALQHQGSYHRIEALGRSESAISAGLSGRLAIEACVEDLYDQVSLLLQSRS